jgi:hypothetical protein
MNDRKAYIITGVIILIILVITTQPVFFQDDTAYLKLIDNSSEQLKVVGIHGNETIINKNIITNALFSEKNIEIMDNNRFNMVIYSKFLGIPYRVKVSRVWF